MEETLISFECAKLVKRKGIILNTQKSYNDCGKLCIQSNYPHYIDNEDISAPTQSHLQKYLREKHNIHINIRYEQHFYISNYKYYHYDISQDFLTDVTEQE